MTGAFFKPPPPTQTHQGCWPQVPCTFCQFEIRLRALGAEDDRRMMTEIELAQTELNAAAIAWYIEPSVSNERTLYDAVDNFRRAAAIVVKRAATHNPNEAR